MEMITKGPFKCWYTAKGEPLKVRWRRWKMAWLGLANHLVHVLTFGYLDPPWWENSMADFIFGKNFSEDT